MKRAVRPEIQVVICLILSAALLSSCSAFRGLLGKAKIERPQVDFMAGRLTKLSFDAADFLFDLKIRNPNPLGVSLAGFDYDFLINGNSFLKGKQEKEVQIEAEGESTIQLPLSLRFVDLYRTFETLRDQDISTYRLDCGFSFDLPVLGLVSVPVSKEGDFPLLKLPTVNLDALKLKSLTLSGAELQLMVRLKNPNALSMMLERLQYQFEINGVRWISGDVKENVQVTSKGESLIEIPISLDFLQMGRSVYQILTGDRSLSYQFGGKLDLATSIPLLSQVSLPFDRSGSIKVTSQ
jgi:LEA14-like dessication related protein